MTFHEDDLDAARMMTRGPITRRQWIKNAILAGAVTRVCGCATVQTGSRPGPSAQSSPPVPREGDKTAVSSAASGGLAFLASLFDSELDLLPEYRRANIYWLFHDNYLAAKVLGPSHPQLAERIERAMRHHGVVRSGKIEILFDEAEKPLPFRRYRLVEVKQIGAKQLKTEIVEDEPLAGWQRYADLLLLAAVALAKVDSDTARKNFDAAVAMWDGHGFNDLAAGSSKQYSTYKLALALIAGAKLGIRSPIDRLVLQKLLAQQAEDGGWITDYDAAERRLGVANVETTSLAILALVRCGA